MENEIVAALIAGGAAVIVAVLSLISSYNFRNDLLRDIEVYEKWGALVEGDDGGEPKSLSKFREGIDARIYYRGKGSFGWLAALLLFLVVGIPLLHFMSGGEADGQYALTYYVALVATFLIAMYALSFSLNQAAKKAMRLLSKDKGAVIGKPRCRLSADQAENDAEDDTLKNE